MRLIFLKRVKKLLLVVSIRIVVTNINKPTIHETLQTEL